MPTLTIELLPHQAQRAFNLRRWAELLADPALARFEGRVETDRHGHIIISPPPAPSHGSFQSEIAYLLRSLMPRGRVLTECPISTADGVKAADVAWASPECMRELGNRVCFPEAPEICVESSFAQQHGSGNPGKYGPLFRRRCPGSLGVQEVRSNALFWPWDGATHASFAALSSIPKEY